MPTKPVPLRPLVSVALGGALFASTASAYNLGGIAIHGSASTQVSASDEYNLYGDTADQFDLNISELIVNGSYRFENGIRAGAQLYAYSYTREDAVTLDWASLDYQFRPEFGIRLGRNKRAYALYGDTRDLDQVRIFATLPGSFYPLYLRTITSSTDGITTYGTFDIGSGGSLDYSFHYGSQATIRKENLLLQGFRPGPLSLTKWSVPTVGGGQLIWNTPLEGLRATGSFTRVHDSDVDGYVTAAPFIPGGLRDAEVDFTSYGIEYTRGDWTFASEWQMISLNFDLEVGGAVVGPNAKADFLSYYFMAGYQATSRLGLGAYVTFQDTDPKDRAPGSKRSETAQDYTVAASYAVKPWWLLKLELHHVVGTAYANVGGEFNVLDADDYNYVVLKTTISF